GVGAGRRREIHAERQPSDCLRRRARGLEMTIDDGDPRARGVERAHDRLPDRAAATGDNEDLIGQHRQSILLFEAVDAGAVFADRRVTVGLLALALLGGARRLVLLLALRLRRRGRRRFGRGAHARYARPMWPLIHTV